MRFSASINFLFRELPFLARFEAARAAGFEGVEIQFLPDIEIDEVAREAHRARMEVVVLNVGMGDLFEGGPGLSGVPGREAQFASELSFALRAAECLRAHCLHVGPSRVPAGVTREDCMTTYLRNVAIAVEGCRQLRTRTQVVIEAMNRIDMPDALLSDVDAAAALIRKHFPETARLMFDIYHVAMNGADIVRHFTEHQSLVRHVQFSNVPNRHEPDRGELDIDHLIAALAAHGYDEWIGAEYRPTVATEQTLGWLQRSREAVT